MKHKTAILYIGNKVSRHGYTPTGIETLGSQLKSVGYTVYYAGTKGEHSARMTEMLGAVIKYRRIVSFILIDTYSTRAFWYAFMAGMLARLFSIKYIPILRGGSLPLRLKKSKWMCDRLFNNAYRNIAVSGYLHKAFADAGYDTVIIPNNIDISRYEFFQRTNPRPRLLWVRSFEKTYNPNMAVDVLANLSAPFPDAALCMVGPDKDGSMESFKQYASEMGMTDKIRITGKLSKEAWTSLAKEYDFFINTTNVDNMPVSVIEALALGLCVISTNPGGVPYLLSHNEDAMLVNTGDHEAMAQHIRKLIGDTKNYRRIVTNGRQKADSFDWEVVKHQWLEILKT